MDSNKGSAHVLEHVQLSKPHTPGYQMIKKQQVLEPQIDVGNISKDLQ